MKKCLSALLSLSILITVTMCFSTSAVADTAINSNDIVVLYTNDVHCNVSKSSKAMGVADVAGYKEYVKDFTDNVTLVDNGDFIQGGPMGTLSKGEMLIDIMNKTGYDIATYGNHEFDYGMPNLEKLVAKSNAKFISCNFTNLKTNKTVAEPYEIKNYNGVKIAYVGISTPKTITSSTPKYFQDDKGNFIYGFCQDSTGKKLYDTVQNSVESAKSQGADYVVAMSHLGLGNDDDIYSSQNLIKNTTGIDVVLDGHSHSVIESETVKNKSNQNVTLTSTGTKLANLGQLVIDTNGTKTTADDKLTTELLPASQLTDAYQNSAYTSTLAFVDEKNKELDEILNNVIAQNSVDLTTNKPNGFRGIRDRETNMGDFVADAYRIVMGADVSLVNGGGIRADIKPGNMTNGDLLSVQPFSNSMCLVEATGQQIIDAIEFGARFASVNPDDPESGWAMDENGGWFQVSGIRYCVDLLTPTSATTDENGMLNGINGKYRVCNVHILDKKSGLYLPIDVNKTYKLASSSYVIKNSGDGNNVFCNNKLLLNDSMSDYQCLVDYVTDNLNGKIPTKYENIEGEGRIKTLADAHHTCEFGDWITVTPATKDHDGLMIRYCSQCNKSQTKVIKYQAEPTTEPTTNPSIETTTEKSTTTKQTTNKNVSTSKKSPKTGAFDYAYIMFAVTVAGAGLLLIVSRKSKKQG